MCLYNVEEQDCRTKSIRVTSICDVTIKAKQVLCPQMRMPAWSYPVQTTLGFLAMSGWAPSGILAIAVCCTTAYFWRTSTVSAPSGMRMRIVSDPQW